MLSRAIARIIAARPARSAPRAPLYEAPPVARAADAPQVSGQSDSQLIESHWRASTTGRAAEAAEAFAEIQKRGLDY